METDPTSQDCNEVIQSDLNFDCKENSLENNNVEGISSNNSALQFTSVIFKSITPSSVTSMSFSFTFKPGEDIFAECSIEVPKPWSLSKSSIGEEETLLFTWVTSVNDNGIKKLVLEKWLVITADREIKYEVHSTPVDVDAKKLPTILHDIKSLPELLKKFKDMRVCKGVYLNDVPQNSILKNSLIIEWHHADCKMLSINYERCLACRRMTKSLSQKARRLQKLEKEKYKRIPVSTNSLDQIKLKMLQKKVKHRTRRAKNYKRRLDTLIETISQQQQNTASIYVEGFEMKCSSHKIPHNQKIVMNEIISAAKRTSPNGRRYSEEFIMLCMLMNIRSNSYYEFLRKNEILPLPCTKTIRDYISLFGTTCGLDEAFFQLLAKSFKSENIMKRHDVLLLDEIGLRKAIVVSTKTLTYTGIADYGPDGPKSSDMNDLAMHGLVLMYQSLTDKYTQPIAVFASKNSVPADELAKLVVKAICLLEKAGALIHAIIGDGATTNDKMWKVLGVDASAKNTKTWFTHPCSDYRKIFIFSDTPHLIKCIRNRLFNNGHLRVDSEEGEIKWDYFAHLFSIDSSQPGNARVCPKISRRHIELDNTGKMRVRFLATPF